MQATSLANVLDIAARHYPGKSREFLLREINKVRKLKWLDPAAREQIFKASGVAEAQRFYNHANCGARSTQVGVSMPFGVVSVEHVEHDGQRIPVESQPDLDGVKPRLTAFVRATKACLERDIVSPNAMVGFYGVDGADNGSRIGVEYVTRLGAILREDVLLSSDGNATSQTPHHFTSITLPRRCGYIKVMTDAGIVLGSYHPSIVAPQHLRVEISGARVGQAIQWTGLREPIDVTFDSDLVEFDGELSWKSALTFVELHLKTTKTAEESQTYNNLAQFDMAANQSSLKATMGTPSLSLRPRSSGVLFRRLRSLNG